MKIKMCSYCGKVFGDAEEYGYEHCWECGEKDTISDVTVYTQAELDEAVRAERIRAKTEAYMNLVEVVKSWTMREIKEFENG